MNAYKIISDSESKTKSIAGKIAQTSQTGDIYLLDGELGTGKTHFIKGFTEDCGYVEKVTSPTFNIANFYNTEKATVIHVDLYRINTIEEFNDLGIMEYFPESIVLIEWGEKIAEYLDEYFSIHIKYIKNDKNSREISFAYNGNRYLSKMETINKILNLKS